MHGNKNYKKFENVNFRVSRVRLEDGSTELYSLYEYKDFRENMDAEKGYLQGRFDAIPIVDNSVGALKKLLERADAE